MKSSPSRRSRNRASLPSSKNFPPKRGAKNSADSIGAGVFIVEGLAAVQEYLRHKPTSILKVFVKRSSLKSLESVLKQFDPALLVHSDDEPGHVSASPIWAHVKHELGDWQNFLNEIERADSDQIGSVLVLDHISDPRNLGAIMRTSAFFGIHHVIVPERRQVLLTQASVNTAQGGFALSKLIVVVNVSRALEELKAKGFWVLGAAMNGESVSKLKGRYSKQVLVLGSEDKGISPGVLRHCDVLVGISGARKSLDSLNVSVAAGILIHQLMGLT
jgi:predicted rRNA methylase